jgi:hypothetical protein
VIVETKEQSKQWMHTHSPNKLKKFKQTSARKLVAALFWGRKGVKMVEFMQQRTTILSEMYCKTSKKLHRALQNRLLTSNVVLLMAMRVRMQQLVLKHCWSISTWSCLTTFLTAVIIL